jgi:hypothetical protein
MRGPIRSNPGVGAPGCIEGSGRWLYEGKDGRPIRTSLLGLASKMPKPMNRRGSMESVARADPLRRVIGR